MKPAAPYLGFMVGPAANEEQFDAPTRKWRSRAAAIANRHSAASVPTFQYNTRALPVLGYKMQLALPPNRIFRLEMGVLTHVLHMATRALDRSAFFNLSSVGGPNIKSMKALSVATLMRTTIKTIPSWREDYDTLVANSEALPGATLVSGVLWNACWDSPAIAALLRHAACGFPAGGSRTLGIDQASWLTKDEEKFRATVMKTLGRLKKSPTKIKNDQADLAENITNALYPAQIDTLFEKRLGTVFVRFTGERLHVDWIGTFKLLRGLSMHEAMCYVKTICNSWTTSSRYHDGKLLNCAFGCRGAPDDLAHYICCPRLWTEVDVAAGASDEEELDSVRQRLLVEDPTDERARRIVIAFSVYHALKLGHLNLIQKAATENDYGEVLNVTHATAAAYAIKHSRHQEPLRRTVAPSVGRAASTPSVATPLVTTTAAGYVLKDVRGEGEDEPAPATPRVVTFAATPEWQRDLADAGEAAPTTPRVETFSERYADGGDAAPTTPRVKTFSATPAWSGYERG